MTSIGRAARLAIVACAMLLGALTGTVALAADPEPPITLLSWGGSPNIPVWQTFDLRSVPGTEPVGHYECSLDGAPWTVCTSPWDPDVTGGEHTFAARAVDTNGLADPTPEIAVLWVDAEGPVVSLAINDGAAVTGRYLVRLAATFQDRTSVHTVLISSSPEVDDLGRLLNAMDTSIGLASGTWSWRLDDERFGGTATPGLHTVYIQGEDAFGNRNAPVAATIAVDPDLQSQARVRLAVSENPAPIGDRVIAFALVEAVDGAAIADGMLSLWIDVPGWDLQESATGWTVENGVFVDASRLGPGSYTVTARYFGSADLADDTETMTLRIGPAKSLMGPYAYFQDPTPYPTWDTPAPFRMGVHSRYDEALSFECRIDDAPWKACTDPFEVPLLPAGTHTAEVRGIDLGGAVQAVPEFLAWRWSASAGGGYWLHPQTGDTGDPVVYLTADAPDGALAMRLSNGRGLDAEGRLAAAKEISPPPELGPGTSWNVTDPAYGGTPGDGRKLVWLQWQLADGSWTIPDLASTILDRTAPTVTLKLEGGRPFVDEDQLLAVVKASERVQVCLGDTPEAVTVRDCSGRLAKPVDDGLGLIPWPVGDVPAGTVATRRLYASAHDSAGNWSPVVEASITIDRTEPVASLRPVAFVRGSSVTLTSVALRVWGSATDTGSGVHSMAIQETTGSSTRTVGSVTDDAVAVERRVPFTASRTWRVRAVDRLGHVGAWTSGALVRPVRRDDGSAAVIYRGPWARASSGTALGRSVHRSTRAGATASTTFTGRAVGIVMPRGPGRGKVDVLVDGVQVATIDTRAAWYHPREIVFAKAWSIAGRHTVTLRVRGAAGRPVSLDGFVFVP